MSQPGNLLSIFVTTSPGLETALSRELESLGFERPQKGRAGVSLRGDRVALERIVASSRLAHRVLWTLGEVDARDGDWLYRGVFDLVRWHGLIPPEATLAVFATTRDTPAFRDARFVALRAKDAIVDAVRAATGTRPDVDTVHPDVVVRVSVARGRGVVSLDAAGRTSLHARGYRTDAGEAPLRETLAAALLTLAGWNPELPLVDPMCGSGTIAIEAALIARGILPGHLRKESGFMLWPGFRRERYDTWLASLHQARSCPAPIIASDLDPAVLAVARVNGEQAGVRADIAFDEADAATIMAPEGPPGLLVTNPPWGGRMGDEAATGALLARVATHWRAAFPHWRAAILVPDREAAHHLGLGGLELRPLESGGKDILLATGTF
jgi:putative N6-adenine-specific DNA methylase